MSVSAVANAAAHVPLGVEPRPPHQEAGDGQTEDVTGSRTTESDGTRRVVLARAGETGADQRRDADEESRADPEQLTDEERQVVREMAARDREVRAHEMAHMAAGGAHVTSGPTFSYQQGPDGKRYAVGGEVGIDTSAEDDPQATIAKMAQVRAAALAPAEPSGADRAVAAAAAATAAQARAELIEERSAEAEEARAEREGAEGAAGVEPAAGAATGPVGEIDGQAGAAESSAEPTAAATGDSGASEEAAQRGGSAHHHVGGGACPDCVGARYGAAGTPAPVPSLDVAA